MDVKTVMNWRIGGLVVVMLGGIHGATLAQEQPALVVSEYQVLEQRDAFGVNQLVLSGVVHNTSTEEAFQNVSLFAEGYTAEGELVAEAFGILVNQCNENTPPDFVLKPEHAQRFFAPLDVYEADAQLETFAFFLTQTALPTQASPIGETALRGVIPIVDREVVRLEWVTTEAEEGASAQTVLRFAEGCYRDVFTAWEWSEFDPATDTLNEIEHPRAAFVTDPVVRERLQLLDETLFNRSFISFAPNGNRLVHQTELNDLITAEANGTYRRLLDDELFRSTLQGINWFPNERFIAYYYGAFGDQVTYLVASSAGQYASTPQRYSIPSVTVPGVLPDASHVIISGQFGEETNPTGYYLKPVATDRYELLFEWENLPGNNFPAPVVKSRGGLQVEDALLFVLPTEDGNPHLYCYDRRASELFDLTPLPFSLSTSDRAYMEISPDYKQLAIAATGVNGGLWLIELDRMGACQE
jgi:hypothetical protein